MGYRNTWRSNPEIAVKTARLKLTKLELPFYSTCMENDHSYQGEAPAETEAPEAPEAPEGTLDPAVTTVAGLILLTERVERLTRLCERLARENQVLREQQAVLQTERDALREKNEQSRTRIDVMVARLKGLEQG